MKAASLGTPALYTAIALVYLSCFPYHPALRSPNELCRLWQSRALIDDRTLDINGVLRRSGWVGDLSVKDGKYYPSKAPLLSFAAAPIYAGLSAYAAPGKHVPERAQVFWSRLLLTVLPTLLMLIYLRRFLLDHVSAHAADLVVATYALGSMALCYSWMFVSHQTTAVLVFGAFYALYRMQQRTWRKRGYLGAGAFAGAAVACEYTAALPVAALAIYAVHAELTRDAPLADRARSLTGAALLAVVGAAPFLGTLLAYHQVAFGHPLQSGYKYLADVEYQDWHVGGFLGIRLPVLRDFTRSFVSPLRGLFAISPFLLLALPGGVALLRARSRLRSLVLLQALLLAGYAYFTASFSYVSWGWAAGPRHMTPWLPFLTLPVALWIDQLAARAPRWAFLWGASIALCALSIVVAGSVSFVNYIPDALSTALFGAVLPLLRAGYFPVTVLGFLGLPNPHSGMLLLMVIVGIALLLFARAVPIARRRWPLSLVGALVTVAIYVGILQHATQHDRSDRDALQLLRSSWWGRPGQTQRLWP